MCGSLEIRSDVHGRAIIGKYVDWYAIGVVRLLHIYFCSIIVLYVDRLRLFHMDQLWTNMYG